MSKYRHALPLLGDRRFVSDGGLETTLVFHDGMDLPCFASYGLVNDGAGLERLRAYYEEYIAIARRHGTGFLLETPTWRANPDWGAKLGDDREAVADANRIAVGLMLELRDEHETPQMPIVVSGNIGPRGDGYVADARMTAAEARDYHAFQVGVFADSDADLVSAFTLNYVEEAIGVVQAARDARMPVVVSFTVETDGKLPGGDTLQQAIERTDAATDFYAAYYMINCAHPTHFAPALAGGGSWIQRIRGLRANASCLSHADLDAATELDAGDPADLAARYRAFVDRFPQLTVFGGCCGTDHRHVAAIADALAYQTRLIDTPPSASNAVPVVKLEASDARYNAD